MQKVITQDLLMIDDVKQNILNQKDFDALLFKAFDFEWKVARIQEKFPNMTLEIIREISRKYSHGKDPKQLL